MRTQTQRIPEWQQPIISVPLTQAFPALGEVREFRNKQCLFNHDRSKLFDVVSSRYQPIPHTEALEVIGAGLKESFGEGIDAKVLTLRGGSRIRATYKLPIRPIEVARGDLTELSIVVQNSYDRSCQFSASLGALRLVCSNGMSLGFRFGSVSMRHVVAARDAETGIKYLSEDLSKMASHAPKIRELWMDWRETLVDHDWAVEVLEGQFPSKYLDRVLDEKSFPKTKWGLYNELTSFATHDTKTLQRRIDFDERIARLFYQPEEV